jgi:poly-gamma-glutamate synthesis protein (capsule biosynthesis protein)
MATASFLTGGDVAPIRKTGLGMFGDIAQLFRRADVSFFNLELPLSDRGESVRGKSICHRGMPVNIDGITEAGVSCVNLANNHVLTTAMWRCLTRSTCSIEIRLAILAPDGTSMMLKGYVVENTGMRIGFPAPPRCRQALRPLLNARRHPPRPIPAYRSPVSLLEYPQLRLRLSVGPIRSPQRLRNDVEVLRNQVNVLMVYVHWGASMSPHVHSFQREIGKAAIDAGAHAVFGGHQHVMSAIEFYRGCPIVHGSGNLLFDTWTSFFNDETLKSFLFGATIEADGLRDCYLLPVKTGVNVPPRLLFCHDPLWKAIYEDLQERCGAFGTKLNARESVIEVRHD